MTDDRPFRYSDAARSLGESLQDIQVAPPPDPITNPGALDRIARGETAFAKMAGDPSQVHVPNELKKQELKQKLKTLLTEKQQRDINKQLKVAVFVERSKRADPTEAGLITGSMMAGTDVDDRKTPARREQGQHQGPAANFIARSLKELREEEAAARKTAASRLDKEVKAGRVTYAQAYPGEVPGMYEQLGQPGMERAKNLARMHESMPAQVAEAPLARRRQLNDALYRNKMRLGGEGNTALVNAHMPGGGPMNVGVPFTDHTIAFTPDTSGQWIRAKLEGQHQAARQATFGRTANLPARQGVDSTLNRGIMEHELEEGASRVSKVIHPHATHAGVGPILRENLAIQGDPEAAAVFKRMRGINPDDELVQKAMKQVGAHPDRPLAMNGRQQAAVEKILTRKKDQLLNKTKATAAAHQLFNTMSGRQQTVATVPTQLGQQATQLGQSIRSVHKPLVRPGSLWQRGRNFASNYRNLNAQGNAFGNALKALAT